MDEFAGEVEELEMMPCPFYLGDKNDRCELPAEVQFRDYVDSTDGPVEIVAVRCVMNHFFTGPRDAMWA